jgi:hypothetical protein
MHNRNLSAALPSTLRPLALVLGTNEIASAVAVHLVAAGSSVVLSHDPFPPVMRRAMAFHDALFGDKAVVEGIEGELAETGTEIAVILAKPCRVAVTPLHLSDLIALRYAQVLVDARMQKHRVTPDLRGVAHLAIGLGPNFASGVNCDIAIETRPARNGTILTHGQTDPADGEAAPLGGVGKERFVYAEHEGLWHTPIEIGMRVFKGFVVGYLDGSMIRAPIDGRVRGIARDSTRVPARVKLLEIDPRGRRAKWTGIDARGQAIAQATVRATRLHAAEQLMRKALAGAAVTTADRRD